ncbi:MAG: ACT domain-containing protein, partial [Chloroflexi bacterium]|nr:ACT domain-containing protein [Chloroflexota bacterium]
VGDIIDVARNLAAGATGRLHETPFEERAIVPIKETCSRFYMRVQALDRPGVIARIATVLGDHNVSISSVLQKGSDGESAEIIWVTHRTPEGQFRAAIDEIRELPVVHEIASVLRVEPE